MSLIIVETCSIISFPKNDINCIGKTQYIIRFSKTIKLIDSTHPRLKKDVKLTIEERSEMSFTFDK